MKRIRLREVQCDVRCVCGEMQALISFAGPRLCEPRNGPKPRMQLDIRMAEESGQISRVDMEMDREVGRQRCCGAASTLKDQRGVSAAPLSMNIRRAFPLTPPASR